MKRLNLTFVNLIILGFTILSCSREDDSQTHPVETDNPMVSEIDLLIDTNFRPYIENPKHVGLSIAVIDGIDTYYYNYGETHKKNNVLPTKNSLYEIGSITKTFTAALATRLMLNAEISEDITLSELLPDDFLVPSYQGEEIKLKHLFNHTSGLPPVDFTEESKPGFNPYDPYANYDYAKMKSFLGNYQLERAPGSHYEYSNIGFLILTYIVEHYGGESIENLLNAFIMIPLEMHDTHMSLGQVATINSNVMGAYDQNGHDGMYWNWGSFKGVGGLYSNVVDLEKYVRAHFDNFSAIPELKEALDVNKIETYANPLFGVGRALHIIQVNGNPIYNHSGGSGGFGSFMFFDPIRQKGIIVFGNNFLSATKLQDICLSFKDEFFKN